MNFIIDILSGNTILVLGVIVSFALILKRSIRIVPQGNAGIVTSEGEKQSQVLSAEDDAQCSLCFYCTQC